MTGLALLGFAATAQASTLSVCSSCTYTTISAAITAATDADTISVAAGTYNETLTIKKELTIQGVGTTTIITGLVDISDVKTSVKLKSLAINGSSARRCVYVESF